MLLEWKVNAGWKIEFSVVFAAWTCFSLVYERKLSKKRLEVTDALCVCVCVFGLKLNFEAVVVV